jgi:hypothetical protein
MISDFKAAASAAQALSRSAVSEAETREMLAELKGVKIRLGTAKPKCTERLAELQSVPQQVESLEKSLTDLNDWLTEGESIINSLSLEGSAELVDDCLKRHQVLFAVRSRYEV